MVITRFLTVFWLVLTLLCVVSVSTAYAETEAARRARLEAELSKIEGEIKVQQVILDVKSGERKSLERDVAVLDGEINRAQLAIRQRNLTISQIANDVKDRTLAVAALDEKIQREKDSAVSLVEVESGKGVKLDD